MKKDFRNMKKIVALLLTLCMVFSAFCCIPVSAQSNAETETGNYVSRIVKGANGKNYVEYLGKPYLMYAMQMRIDWAFEDKGGDEAFIAENFEKVVADGFTSVAIPIYWCTVEPTKDNYTFERLKLYYKYIDMYDLTVQWLWFGSNVCGGAGLVPNYIKNDTETYKTVTPNIVGGHYLDYTCNATLEREKLALGKMMQWIAENDTDKRCVMIQVNNEVDQAGNYFDPGYELKDGKVVSNGTTDKYWYNDPDKHDAYCWTGGQREECFAYLSALGDVVHNSVYNVVTRVNVSGAGRQMAEIRDDITDLIATTGIDIVGEDIYYQDWENHILPRLSYDGNGVANNVPHLAENGAGYDSSYNTAKSFELGGGLLIYCHRDDRTAKTGGGLYVNSQGETADNANRTYHEWVERDTTAAVRDFATLVSKINQPLANAVANGKFAEFNGDKADTFIGSKKVGDITFEYSAGNDGLGMAFEAGLGEYILTASKGAKYTLSGSSEVFTVSAGYYDGETWISDKSAVTVNGNEITVAAGQIVRVKFGATYEVFGETKAYDLTGNLAVKSETLENGSPIVYTEDVTENKLVLAENVQNFKISYKFQNGEMTKSNTNPIVLTMRGAYKFYCPRWNVVDGDMFFVGNGTDIGSKGQASPKGWHSVEITMLGGKVAILFDGKLWYNGILEKGATSGELSLTFKHNNTQIADLKVETPTAEDAVRIVNADFTTNTNYVPAIKGTYSAEESALKVQDGSTVLGQSNYNNAYNTVESYVFETVFKFDGSNSNDWQRGLRFQLPDGKWVGLFGNRLRISDTKDNLLVGGKFEEKEFETLCDGKYHTFKIDSANDWERFYIDGIMVKENTVTVRKPGTFVYEVTRDAKPNYIKSIKLTDYVAPFNAKVPTMSIFGEDVEYDLSKGLVYDETASEENGYGVISNSTDNERTITLSESVKNFKLSFKFFNGNVGDLDADNVGSPVTAIMRKVENKAYTFGTKYWNAKGDDGSDITFNYYDFNKYGIKGEESTTEGHRDQYGSSAGWHRVEIMMLDGRAVVMFDGIRWHDAEMAVAPVAGELALRLRYADTKIADVKVENVTEADLERVVDFDCNSSLNISVNKDFVYDATQNAYSLKGQFDRGIFNFNTKTDSKTGSGKSYWAQDLTSAENYEFNMTFSSNDATNRDDHDRGTIIGLPSGRWVAFYENVVRITKADSVSADDVVEKHINYSGDYFYYFSGVETLDGKDHTLKVVYKKGKESITVDGKLLKCFDIDKTELGEFAYRNYRDFAGFYVKKFTVTDITDLAVNPTVLVPDMTLSSNRTALRNRGTEINSDSSWVFKTTFCINDLSQCDNNVFHYRFRTSQQSNRDAVYLVVAKNQYYVTEGGDYGGIERITDDNGFVPIALEKRNRGTEINSDSSWVFKTTFCINDLSQCDNNVFHYRFRTSQQSNRDAVYLVVAKNQYYVTEGGDYGGIERITDDNGFVPIALENGKKYELSVAITGNIVTVTFNGASTVWRMNGNIPADSNTLDHVQIDKGYENGNIVFTDTRYESLSGVGTAAGAIDKFIKYTRVDRTPATAELNITEDSGSAIITAEDAIKALGKAERAMVWKIEYLEEAYNTYDAKFTDGDVNENGTVDVIDLIRIKKIAAGTATRTVKSNVDKDAEKRIDAGDIARMRKILLGF